MKVTIKQNYEFGGVDVYFYEETTDQNKIKLVKPVELIMEEVSTYEVLEPTLRLGRIDSHGFLEGLTSALMELGFYKPLDVGELKATKYHLEDLRTLLKINPQLLKESG